MGRWQRVAHANRSRSRDALFLPLFIPGSLITLVTVTCIFGSYNGTVMSSAPFLYHLRALNVADVQEVGNNTVGGIMAKTPSGTLSCEAGHPSPITKWYLNNRAVPVFLLAEF